MHNINSYLNWVLYYFVSIFKMLIKVSKLLEHLGLFSMQKVVPHYSIKKMYGWRDFDFVLERHTDGDLPLLNVFPRLCLLKSMF